MANAVTLHGVEGRIFQDENGVLWNCMLNYTNISHGVRGNNKFYLIQLIADNDTFRVLRKWGRVGARAPQSQVEVHSNLESACKSFQKVFQSKSGNKWPLQGSFQPKANRYVLIELDQETVPKERPISQQEGSNYLPSLLPQSVQNVLKLILDKELIKKEMTAMHIDLKRMPLGKLSKTQISRGYAILTQISQLLGELDAIQGSSTGLPNATTNVTRSARARRSSSSNMPRKRNKSAVQQARVARDVIDEIKARSSEFYTAIPHDFGHQLPPAIDSMEHLRMKLDLLQVLDDLEASQDVTWGPEREEREQSRAKHPMDEQFEQLKVDMAPLLPSAEEHQVLESYVNTSHAPSHSQYKLKIDSILKLERLAERKHEDVVRQVGNRKLLWHGSRLSNMAGILKKGLRITPPEAPSSGSLFGKGLYFADSVSKSAEYCRATRQQPKGILLLAEVALGVPYQTHNHVDVDWGRLQSEFSADSVHAVGAMAPSVESHVTMQDGVLVPMGKLLPLKEKGCVFYNEFVVYRPEQVRLRYLLTVDFQFR